MSTATKTRAQAPSREFNLRRRAYVVKMREDVELPASAKLVCWVIAEHWNEKSGDAFVSTATIGDEAGMSQTHVRRVLRHPRVQKHLRIEFGSKGSGHPNRYFPIEPPSAQSDMAIEPSRSPIEPPSAMNLTNHSAASAARSEFVDTGEPIVDSARAFGALTDTFCMDFKDHSETASAELFKKLLQRGEHASDIIAGAERYSNRVSQTGEPVMILQDWLSSSGWKP